MEAREREERGSVPQLDGHGYDVPSARHSGEGRVDEAHAHYTSTPISSFEIPVTALRLGLQRVAC